MYTGYKQYAVVYYLSEMHTKAELLQHWENHIFVFHYIIYTI